MTRTPNADDALHGAAGGSATLLAHAQVRHAVSSDDAPDKDAATFQLKQTCVLCPL